MSEALHFKAPINWLADGYGPYGPIITEEQNDVNILISIVYQLLLDFKEVP